MKYPWLCNYVISRFPDRQLFKDRDFWNGELWMLAILARGVCKLMDKEQVRGNRINERVCLAVLYRFRKMANFSLIVDPANDLVRDVKTAQIRIEGLKISR